MEGHRRRLLWRPTVTMETDGNRGARWLPWISAVTDEPNGNRGDRQPAARQLQADGKRDENKRGATN